MCGVWYTSVGVCSGIRGHLWFCVWVRGTYMCLHVLACLPSGEGIVWFCCMCVQCYVHILKLLLLHRSCSELILGGGLSSPRSALLADTRPKAPCAWEKLGTRGWVGPSEEDNQQRLAQIPNALKASIEFEALLFINSGKNVALRAGALVPYITQAPGSRLWALGVICHSAEDHAPTALSPEVLSSFPQSMHRRCHPDSDKANCFTGRVQPMAHRLSIPVGLRGHRQKQANLLCGYRQNHRNHLHAVDNGQRPPSLPAMLRAVVAHPEQRKIRVHLLCQARALLSFSPTAVCERRFCPQWAPWASVQ